MIVTGRYTSAEVFTDDIEEAALQWVREQCDSPAFDGVRIAQMPDVHAGNSCNVGTVYRIGPYVNPDHVGVDIGCTVSMHRLTATVSPRTLPCWTTGSGRQCPPVRRSVRRTASTRRNCIAF